jgi:hypothetical protein
MSVIAPLGNETSLMQYLSVNIYLEWLSAVDSLFSKSDYFLRTPQCVRIRLIGHTFVLLKY